MYPGSLKFSFISALFFIASFTLEAQSFRTSFKGIIVDEADLPLPGVTLMVLQASDSVLVQFSSTSQDGSFLIPSVPKGEYTLSINFLGMQTTYKSLQSGPLAEVNLGTIKMVSSTTLLTEVEVTADHIPIQITKDTISYNADAFETQPNAVVEDLLKKLPGIEVAIDGSIKAQGEDVQKVLVDGKEFFGTDPKMATKNLPANAVKKVKVYDKKSDIAEFTGVDDGEREKTIDLQLREEFKQGLFGKAEAGYGSNDKYNAKIAFNRFSKTSQLSILGQLNNINQQGFSFTDQLNFSGGTGGGRSQTRFADLPGSGSQGTGLITTGAGGINFNLQTNPKFNIRSSYFFNSVDNTLLEDIFRQNLSDNPFDTEENIDQSTENTSHSFTFNTEIKPDSTQQINFNGRYNFGNGISMSEEFLQNKTGSNLESESFTISERSNDNLSYNGTLSYMKLLGKDGRNIATSFTLGKNNNDSESILNALTEYFLTGQSEALDQLQYSVSDNKDWSGLVSYTEILGERKFLEFNYFYNESATEYDKSVSDIINAQPVINPDLSTVYSSLYSYHRPGVTFRYSGETQNLNIALQLQDSKLSGNDTDEMNQIVKKYRHLLPRIIWRNDLGNGKNIRFNYTTRINPPNITQLSPVADNTDPLRQYVGNPDLNAEYTHSVNINFHSFTQFSSTSFFATAGAGLTNNKIITSRSIDIFFRETLRPINIDNEIRYNVYSSFGRPFKALRSRINLHGSATYTNTQNVIDSELLDVNRWSRMGGISFSNMNSKVLEYNFGGRWTFTDSYYKIADTLNQNTLLHNYYADLTLTLWEKWKIGGSYNFNLYTSDAFSENQSLPLMKLSLSRNLFQGDKGQIILSVFDVLDENRGLSRSSEVNYIEEIKSNSIGRYAMLTFVYSLRSAGEEPAGAARKIFHHRF